jgi:cation diffusion facilitator family transporter
MAGQSKKTVLVAVAANGVIAVAKGAAGLMTGSSSMLAEAAHSVADTTNQGMLLLSLSLAERPPDEEHPFGYGKERYFWTLLAAVMIFLAGAIFAIGQGVLEIVERGKEKGFWLALGTMGIAFLAEGWSFVRAVRQTRGEAKKAGIGFVAFVRESKDPIVKAVVSEDAAALLGLVVATSGLVLAHVTGNPVFDGAGAVLVGLLLVVVAVLLGFDTKGLLLGEAAPHRERERLRQVLLGHESVQAVTDLRTMYVGPNALLVAARVDLDDEVPAGEVERLADELETELREAVPAVEHVFLDPTGARAATRTG